MSKHAFRSHARNGEDIVLWRAFAEVPDGRFVNVSANSPITGSLTAALAEQGWTGVEIPAASVGDGALAHILEEHAPLHVLVLDADGTESALLAGFDLERIRPVVLLVRAAPPLETGQREPDWEPAVLGAGYRFRLFTGLFRIYVAAEHDATVGDAVCYPACVLDAPRAAAPPSAVRDDEDAIQWRALALRLWNDAADGSAPVSAAWDVRAREAGGKASWRTSRPVRIVRSRLAYPALKRAAETLRSGR